MHDKYTLIDTPSRHLDWNITTILRFKNL